MRFDAFIAALAKQRPDLEIRRSGGDGHVVIRDTVARKNLVVHACYKDASPYLIRKAAKLFGYKP